MLGYRKLAGRSRSETSWLVHVAPPSTERATQTDSGPESSKPPRIVGPMRRVNVDHRLPPSCDTTRLPVQVKAPSGDAAATRTAGCITSGPAAAASTERVYQMALGNAACVSWYV